MDKNNNYNYPLPIPDRRILTKDRYNTNNIPIYNSNNNNDEFTLPKTENMFANEKGFSNFNATSFDRDNNITLVQLKHIEDMRKHILNFKLLQDQDMYLYDNYRGIRPTKCNIMLFGPSGSGKSSFIKSMYRSLYNTKYLPPSATEKLIIKSSYQNEGTVHFTKLYLKEETSSTSGIVVCDTRGHINMNEYETEQFKIIIDGQVKDNAIIEQRKERNPYNLWEFWKKDSELFPKEIFDAKNSGSLDSIPHSVVFVFDGSKDEVIEKEEEKFYKELVKISRRKGYDNIHVILTRIDMLEKYISHKKDFQSTERSTSINTAKDEKIERINEVLNIDRSNIHFIENYHSDNENVLEIDFHVLKTLKDVLSACEHFLMKYLSKNEACWNCFSQK